MTASNKITSAQTKISKDPWRGRDFAVKHASAADTRQILPYRRSHEGSKPTYIPWLYAGGFLVIPALRNGGRLTPREHLLFVYLLKAAAFRDHVRDFHGHPVAVGVGEMIITVRHLAGECYWPQTTIHRMLGKFQALGLITRESKRVGSIPCTKIEICDYQYLISGSNYKE